MIVPVDFNEGKAVYTGIKEALADKDVGILGKGRDLLMQSGQPKKKF